MLMRLALVTCFCAATPLAAEFQKVATESEFRRLVAGKTLTRPMVRLTVSPQGAISGRGMTWDVSGQWDWQNGYFCRDLAWGGDDLGYNCQEVKVNGSKVRFTSDQGTGQSAVFTLN